MNYNKKTQNSKDAYKYPEGSKNKQMDKCPSGQMSNGLLSAWTIVRLDDCPPGRLSSYPEDL